MPVQLGDTLDVVRVGEPAALFDAGLEFAPERQQYVVAPGGQRFLVITRAGAAEAPPPITVLLNWRPPR